MRLLSVNVGRLREVEHEGARLLTGIYKLPVDGRRRVLRLGVEGDAQGDLKEHGGPDKAVYVYTVEDYRWFGDGFTPGKFGENFTIEGLESATACLGDRLHVGSAVLEVSEPRLPCGKLSIKMGEVAFAQRFWASRRFGFYLRVIEEGEVGAGDAIRYSHKSPRGRTIAAVAQARLEERAARAR